MSRRNKPLALIAVVSSATLLNACMVSTPNQNYNPSSSYNRPTHSGAPVDVSDLNNGAENYAKQQLSARGFNQVGEKLGAQFNNTWWLNANTNQCFQLETAGGKVMTLNPTSPTYCHAPNGQQGNTQNPSTNLPKAAETACFRRFNEPGHQAIKTVSPLKPGFWEVIITGKQGRQVACTVDQYGSISDWVNM